MKEIDLDIAHLKELDYSEAQDLNGGVGGWVAWVVGVAVTATAAIINDWECFKDGLAGRPAEHQK